MGFAAHPLLQDPQDAIWSHLCCCDPPVAAGPNVGFISGYLISTPSAPAFQPPSGAGWWNNYTVEKGGLSWVVFGVQYPDT